MSTQVQSRMLSLDIIRILASFCVVFSHVTSASWVRNASFGTSTWFLLMTSRFLTRWTSPTYAMISGFIFLDNKRPITIRSLFRKRISRQLTIYFFWCLVYNILNNIILYSRSREIIIQDLFQFYHLWYLLMNVGLYLLIPLMRPIATNQSLTVYYLVFWSLTRSVIPLFQKLFPFMRYIKLLIQHISILPDWSGYFLLGSYLAHSSFSEIECKGVYIMGALGFSLLSFGTIAYAYYTGQTTDMFMSRFSPGVVLSSAALFFLSTRLSFNVNRSLGSLITSAAKHTFGVYLSHMVFITLFQYKTIIPGRLPLLVSIPFNAILVFLLSFAFSILLKYLPGHNWIV